MAISSTQKYRNTLSGSVGAGMKSVFSPRGKTYFILEHKVTTKYHRAGEEQEIIIDNIEIGRDPLCQVRFDENYRMVSRHHARIIKEEGYWKIVHLSSVNHTYVNGEVVRGERRLYNGDEIQLAAGGPKLGFIVPQGNKATVGSIGLTRRLSLFRQQALRPYKRALTTLAVALVVVAGGMTTWNILTVDKFTKKGQVLAEQIKKNEQYADSLSFVLVENNRRIKEYEAILDQASQELEKSKKQIASLQRQISNVLPADGVPQECSDNTFFVSFSMYIGGNCISSVSGTAFLLSDGRLVTAQHVVNPLMDYPTDESGLLLNGILNQQPAAIECVFEATSPSGRSFKRKYTFDQNPFHMGRFELKTIGTFEFEGMQFPVRVVTECDWRDYAWVSIGQNGGIPFDDNLSLSMPLGKELQILGFPKSVGAENLSHVTPIYTKSQVAREGLDVDGCILLSNSETDHGNSGGPVFTVSNGGCVVVGILSGANRLGSKTRGATDGKWKDRVVPIGKVK